MLAIGWSSSPRQRAERLSSTPIPRRASGRWVRRSPLTELRPRERSKRHEQHVCFTAAYRIQSGRLVLELVGETLRSSAGVGKPQHTQHMLTSGGPSSFSRRIPVDLAQGISVHQAKQAASRLGLGVGLEQRLHNWCTPGVPHLPREFVAPVLRQSYLLCRVAGHGSAQSATYQSIPRDLECEQRTPVWQFDARFQTQRHTHEGPTMFIWTCESRFAHLALGLQVTSIQ